MTKIILVAIALMGMTLTSALAADETPAVQAVFNSFQSSLLAGDTTKAADALAPSVADYFNRLKPLAAPSTPLPANFPTVDHLVVEILRQHVGASAAKQTLPEVASAGLRAGWINLKGFEDVHVGPVTVTGDRATAVLILKNEPTSWSIPFVRTPAGWKLDPLAFYNVGDLLLKAEIARSGFNENKTVRDIAASLAAKKKS